ncbi:MAG: diguanylate cyclase [Paraglaciecola sp.]|jgi:diguanylate cyclase
MHYKKRTTEEYIILSISGASALCILPFFFIRAFNSEWSIAALDFFAVATTSSLFTYVYITSKLKFARWLLAFICVFVVVATVVLKGSEQMVWIYPALVGVFFILTPKISATISILIVSGLGAYMWDDLSALNVVKYSMSTLVTMMFSYAFADSMRKQQRQLLKLSIKDPLTGAGNRRAMEEKLLETVELRQRNEDIPAALILIDLDEFKKVNDQHGHAVGDEVLIHFVEIIEQRIRHTDRVYRFGGEEFVIITDNNDIESVTILAEQLREAIDTSPFPAQQHITISLGIAEYKTGETAFEWLDRADKALYKAKEGGRNLCCTAS